jgi:Zn-dependent protease/CBS domain-containing protein
MRWSWRLGRIAGIDVRMHLTFLILVAWVAVSEYLGHHAWADVGSGTVFLLALFGCVVLHELGHALAARRYGIVTRDITLLPIGGVARLERMPDDPRQELVVALAGPAVNVVISIALYAFLWSVPGVVGLERMTLVGGDFLSKLLVVNVLLAGFNLIPAFPMDGGRVLRALLAMRMDHVRATQVAASIGQALALGFGLLGLFGNPFLLFIALFVWIGAGAEASAAQMRSALGGIPVRQAMVAGFQTLSPREPLEEAMRHVLGGFQQDFPVVDDGRLVGVLTRAKLLRSMAGGSHAAQVGDVMETDFQWADVSEMLDGAFRRLQGCACHALPVLQAGRVVGILTMDDVGKYVMLHAHGRPPAGLPRTP